MTINRELLEILACPKCKGALRLDEAETGLICEKCRLLYEIKDGIPIMLIEEAKPLT
ncbi:MAG TPA: Trm112 family protein [Syntrophales bacterium]|nr:Trm112 family protein [Syntrophales bacterium]